MVTIESCSGHSSCSPGVELKSEDENLKSNSRTKIHDDSWHLNNSLPNHNSVNYSRCPSDHSNDPSFSTMDNLDSMLPDYSEQKAESLSFPGSNNHQIDFSQTPEEIARRQKFLDDAELYSKSYAERPRVAVQASRLGLVKRNSDLPARMSQSGGLKGIGFPLKSSNSESDVRLASVNQVCENVKDGNFEVTSNSDVFEFLEKMPEVHDFLGTSARHHEGTSGDDSERETPFSQENIAKEGKRKVTVVRNEKPDITLNGEEDDERIVVQKRIEKSLEMESIADLEKSIVDDPNTMLKKQGPESLNSAVSGEELISSPPASPCKGKLPIVAVEPLTSPVKLQQELSFNGTEPIAKLVDHRIALDGDLGEKCPLATPESSYTDFDKVEKLMVSNGTKNSPKKGLFIPIDSAVLDRKPSDDEASDTVAEQNVSSFRSSTNIVVKPHEKPREKNEQPRISSEQSRNRSGSRNSDSKPEKRSIVKTSSTGNISVKDRRKQFEGRSASSDSSSKTAANVHISLASRKQMFEQVRDRSQLHKRSSELTSKRVKGELDRENLNSHHVKGNTEIDGASQSNGRLARTKATSLVDLSALGSVSNNELSVKHSKKSNERPRSLFLERLKLDRMEPLKDIQKASEQYAETLEYDKDRLLKKEIDISFESCAPVLNSPRMGKRRFLEDDKTDREPQFV